MKTSEGIATFLKRAWMKFVLRGVHYKDNYEKLDSFYLVNDPWRMDSPCEQYRFAETNRYILEQFGHVGSLLEIGCGEGHQSLHFLKVCDRLVGLDVSNRAVERARKRCTESEFIAADVFSKEIDEKAPFDLVVACEVLCYMKDVPAVLQRMRALGRNVLVTYFDNYIPQLDEIVLSLPGVGSDILQFEQSQWRIAWLHGDR